MPINVLIVDSDVEIQDVVSDYLSTRYDDVVIWQAGNGEQAIDILTEHGDYVDTVLLGTDMPVTDGWEALHIIKDQDNWPKVPVVMMVPHESIWDDALKAHTIGAEHFISKPVSAFELSHVLDGLLVGGTV